MTPSVRREAVLVALPGVALALAGLRHPHHLDYDTARWWFGLHLAGLLVFPLVGVALAWLVRGRHDPLAWLVRVAAYVYATFYTALDIVSGLAAGWVTRNLGPDVPRPPEVSLLFRVGTPIGQVGSAALIVAGLAVAADLLLRGRHVPGGLVVGVLLVGGGWLVHVDHIFAPRGVLGMLLVGAGCALARVLAGDAAPGAATRAPEVDATERT